MGHPQHPLHPGRTRHPPGQPREVRGGDQRAVHELRVPAVLARRRPGPSFQGELEPADLRTGVIHTALPFRLQVRDPGRPHRARTVTEQQQRGRRARTPGPLQVQVQVPVPVVLAVRHDVILEDLAGPALTLRIPDQPEPALLGPRPRLAGVQGSLVEPAGVDAVDPAEQLGQLDVVHQDVRLAGGTAHRERQQRDDGHPPRRELRAVGRVRAARPRSRRAGHGPVVVAGVPHHQRTAGHHGTPPRGHPVRRLVAPLPALPLSHDPFPPPPRPLPPPRRLRTPGPAGFRGGLPGGLVFLGERFGRLGSALGFEVGDDLVPLRQGQLDELLTSYGDLDIVWLDGEFEHTEDEWRYGELRELIRERQPHALVNDRCKGHGDFTTPEQQLPVVAPAGLCESCMTMNQTWGHVPSDDTWKSPRAILHTLVEAASMGGNLLLNVGPTGEGEFPPQAVERLDALASWMERHGESVHGTRAGLKLWQFHGPSTVRRLPDGGSRLTCTSPCAPTSRSRCAGCPSPGSVRSLCWGPDRPWPGRSRPSGPITARTSLGGTWAGPGERTIADWPGPRQADGGRPGAPVGAISRRAEPVPGAPGCARVSAALGAADTRASAMLRRRSP
ncbi:hypothetical protein DRB96_14305 [Streptomyces sp. ICC1]|nr:hypothetical protein DRB96_14305 [Streptomyces sp. ICC1]